MSTRSRPPSSAPLPTRSARFGIARVISKAGVCSRTAAELMVRAGRVALDDQLLLDPEFPIEGHQRGRILIDGAPLAPATRCHVVLNKPRGLVVTAQDEHSRDTIYRCLDGATLPWLAPVGRLDRASEGLLLLSNDSEWAARITDPASLLAKTYHVQVARLPTGSELQALRAGVVDAGECLAASAIDVLRSGGRTAWLEVVLHGGRNRQIRRMLAACDLAVVRLVRVSIGPINLGTLAKGAWRPLDPGEVAALIK